MRGVLIRLSMSICFGLLCLVVFDRMLSSGFKQATEDVPGKMRMIFEDTTYYDVLCLGSSRALAHFDTEVISKGTGLSVYNAGVNGARLLSMKIILESYLERRPPPKILVIHLDEFSYEMDHVMELPFYLSRLPDEYLERNLSEVEPTVRWIARFPAARVFYYDDLQKWIGVKSFLGLGDSVGPSRHGFANLSDRGWNGYWESEFQKRLPLVQAPFDSAFALENGASVLEDIVRVASRNGIRLLLTSSPVPGGENYPKYEAAVSLAMRSAMAIDSQAVCFWSHRSVFPRDAYFYDLVHMVRNGARIYSKAVADTICNSFPDDCRLENKNPGF